jgi:hypothetical protein
MIFIPWNEYLCATSINTKHLWEYWARNIMWKPTFVIKRISPYNQEDVDKLDQELKKCMGKYQPASNLGAIIVLENPKDAMMLKLKFS